MPAMWNAVRNGEPIADTNASHCVMDAIAQANILERLQKLHSRLMFSYCSHK